MPAGRLIYPPMFGKGNHKENRFNSNFRIIKVERRRGQARETIMTSEGEEKKMSKGNSFSH